MAIVLTGSGVGLFNRIGHIGGGINEVNTFRSTTLDARTLTIYNDFLTSDENLVETLFTSAASEVTAQNGYLATLQNRSQAIVLQMANDSFPLNPNTQNNAITAVIAQMAASGSTVQRPTTSVVVTPGGSNVGDGVLIASLTAPTGVPLDMVFAETEIATCTASAQSGGATAGEESFQILGEPATSNTLSELWPLGSGASQTMNCTDASNLTLIENGSFDADWQGSPPNTPPDPWVISAGVVTTNIVRGNNPYKGNFNLRYVGDNSTLTAIYQPLDVTALSPNSVLCFNSWIATTSSSTGVLAIRLVDASNVVITNDQSVSLSTAVDLSTVGTSYENFYGFFQLPAVLPSAVRLQIILTTALNSSKNLDIDMVALIDATQMYAGGPYVGLFSGATNFALNDTFSMVVSTNAGVTSNVRLWDRLYSLRENNLALLSANSPTISDSVIV